MCVFHIRMQLREDGVGKSDQVDEQHGTRLQYGSDELRPKTGSSTVARARSSAAKLRHAQTTSAPPSHDRQRSRDGAHGKQQEAEDIDYRAQKTTVAACLVLEGTYILEGTTLWFWQSIFDFFFFARFFFSIFPRTPSQCVHTYCQYLFPYLYIFVFFFNN